MRFTQVSPNGTARVTERIAQMALGDYAFSGCPVVFWDVLGEGGHPIRTTVSEMGPLLLARMLNLNETQEGVLHIVFKIADDNGMLLLDLKDLRAMLQYAGDNQADFKTQYGNISAASIGAIQRGLLTLESAVRREAVRRAGAGHHGPHPDRRRRAPASSTSSSPTS